LEEYKRGAMQGIFSQEIRFPSTSSGTDISTNSNTSVTEPAEVVFGDWVERRLEDLCFGISSGKTKVSEDGKFNIYGSTGVIGSNETYTHDGKYILVARVGANAGLINYVEEQFSVTDNTLIVDSNKEVIITKFLLYFLERINLNRLVFGSGQPLITGGQLKALKINLPSLPEQTKIANFLSAIDTKIAQNTQSLEKMKTFKRGLLQGMFA